MTICIALSVANTALCKDKGKKPTKQSKQSTKHSSRKKIVSVPPVYPGSAYRGWDYIVTKLLADGLPEDRIKKIYQNPQLPTFSFIPFGLAPKESSAIYSAFLRDDKLRIGQNFLRENEKNLAATELLYGVSRYVITAILLIETQIGKITGTQQIIYRLSRIASVKDPKNLEFNFREHQKKDPTVTLEQVISRADYLESTFYPEIPALIEIAHQREIDALSVRGSIAGAFGMPQFLPSSYLKYAIDGNNDGAISLFDHTDSIHSTANYLKVFGWHEGASIDEKRKAIWAYNRSDAYIDTVLKVSELLRERSSPMTPNP